MNKKIKIYCPLCKSVAKKFSKDNYYICPTCAGIFLEKNLHLSPQKEKIRYEEHNNDVTDIRYQNFVSPITKSVFKNHSAEEKGLDFGSGTGPVISKILTDKQYNVVQYDPYFCNNPKMLDNKYNYIICCEVIEHFANPAKEFRLLKNLLINKGKLYCMTYIYDAYQDFDKWSYAQDPTHVFFYQKETILWISSSFKFTKAEIDGRLITFTK